jgi:hypothetical protein
VVFRDFRCKQHHSVSVSADLHRALNETPPQFKMTSILSNVNEHYKPVTKEQSVILVH